MSHAVDRLNEERERAPCLDNSSPVKMWGTKRRLALDVLMTCWGLGTWLGVNGLYVQLPLLVNKLPEGWTIGASMVLAVQLANVGIVIYALLRRLIKNTTDSPYIYGLLSIGIASLILNAFLYSKTATIGSNEVSLAFLTLTFLGALVGCTSSVLFYPYLRHFRDIYLATYLAGEGLSGFIPSILALIQGVGGEPECVPSSDNSTMTAVYPEPRFDTTYFLIILGGLSAVSLVSFTAVDKCATFRSERVAKTTADKDDEATAGSVALVRSDWLSVLALMALLNALSNGVLPSIQSFSCLPYGTMPYHLAVTLGAMANPAACLAGVWLRPVRARVLALMLAAALLPLGYILATALMSPTPPLRQTAAGSTLIVLSWVLTTGLVSYARMWVYGWARRGGARGMRACGVCTQVGSAVGSVLLNVLVKHTTLFKESQRCT